MFIRTYKLNSILLFISTYKADINGYNLRIDKLYNNEPVFAFQFLIFTRIYLIY